VLSKMCIICYSFYARLHSKHFKICRWGSHNKQANYLTNLVI